MIDSVYLEPDAYERQARVRRPARPWSNREVRRLLRNAGRPQRLATDPLARLLVRALHAASPIAAVRRIVDDAFADQGENGRRLRDLIVACDLDRTLTQADAAGALHLSTRQFFRQRADAISTVASRIRNVLAPALETERPLAALAELVGDSEPDAAVRIYEILEAGGETLDDSTGIMTTLLAARSREAAGERAAARSLLANAECRVATLAAASSAVAYEIAALHCLRARHESRAAALASHASVVRRLAGDDRAAALRANLIEIESALASGDVAAARAGLEFAQQASYAARDGHALGTAVLLQSQLAFLAGDYRIAEEYATAAGFALRRQPADATAASVAIGRARLFLGKRWQPDERLEHAPPRGWERVFAGVVGARHLLLAGDHAGAVAAAERVMELAADLEYHGIWIQAAATLGACAGHTGDLVNEQRWYRAALKRFASLADATVGHDLFALPGASVRDLGPLAIDDDLLDLLADLSERTVGEHRYVPPYDPQRLRAFLRDLLAYAAETEPDAAILARTRSTVEADATLSAIVADDRADLRAALRSLLAIPLHPDRRPAFAKRIDAFWLRSTPSS
ncbi:MAG TPA: hypothetical protein VIG46_01535 [Candidatus Baltobacteraceae bacterium]|jgi:hypothetical protein